MKREKLIPFRKLQKEWYKDPARKRAYNVLESEFALIKSSIDKRLGRR